MHGDRKGVPGKLWIVYEILLGIFITDVKMFSFKKLDFFQIDFDICFLCISHLFLSQIFLSPFP